MECRPPDRPRARRSAGPPAGSVTDDRRRQTTDDDRHQQSLLVWPPTLYVGGPVIIKISNKWYWNTNITGRLFDSLTEQAESWRERGEYDGGGGRSHYRRTFDVYHHRYLDQHDPHHHNCAHRGSECTLTVRQVSRDAERHQRQHTVRGGWVDRLSSHLHDRRSSHHVRRLLTSTSSPTSTLRDSFRLAYYVSPSLAPVTDLLLSSIIRHFFTFGSKAACFTNLPAIYGCNSRWDRAMTPTSLLGT